MRLVILAATGGIGRHLLEQALTAGHDVTAVVRNPDRLSWPAPDSHRGPDHPVAVSTRRTVAADLATADAASLATAVEGADAVLSGLGARSNAEAGVAWRGTRAIVDAMKATGTRRIVVVSAAPIGTVPSPQRPNPPKHDPGDGFFMRHLGAPMTKAMLGAHYADLARMEDVLRDSNLDWTSVRPPRLTDKPVTGTYRTAFGQNLRRGVFISRADVAHYMLRVLDDPTTFGKVMGVAN